MDLIKQHKFYVALAAVFLIAAACIHFMYISPAQEARDAAIAERQAVISRANTAGSPAATDAIIAANKAYAEEFTGQITGVSNLVIEPDVMAYARSDKMLKYRDGDKLIPAWPFDESLHNRVGTYTAMADYVQRLDALVQRLSPTAPPTDAQIAQALREAALKAKSDATTRPGSPALTPAPAVPGAPEFGPPHMGPPHTGQTGTPITVTDEESRAALEAITVDAARNGMIYVDAEKVFQDKPTKDAFLVTPDKLWEYQVKLWVHEDIIDAVLGTLEYAASQKREKLSVVDSPIKRLDSIKVGGYVKATASAAPSAGSPAGMPGMPAGHPGMMPDVAPGLEPHAPAAGPTVVAETPGTYLGNRATSKQWDVINYSFTVTMPKRHLSAFRERLLRRHHVILKEKEEAVPPDGRFFFGTDPVMKITIDAQVLLSPALTRGWADTGGKFKWKTIPLAGRKPDDVKKLLLLPNEAVAKPGAVPAGTQASQPAAHQAAPEYVCVPLMPVEMLKLLGDDALRPEDKTRAQQAATPRPKP